MAAASDETLDAIKRLHPESAPVIAPAGTLPEAPRITGLMIAASLNRLIQTAPGPCDMRANHLLLAFGGGCQKQLRLICQAVVDGRGPNWLRDACLFALPMKGGAIKPIACVEVLRRLASAALLRAWRPNDLTRQFNSRRDECLCVTELVRALLTSNSSISLMWI